MPASQTVYLDNAATSHPKPEAVYAAADASLRSGGSPGRSAHRLALEASKAVFEARLELAALLGVSAPERIILTPGCTAALNFALKGMKWRPGDRVLVSSLEHNAVMRPLMQLASTQGIAIEPVPYAPGRILDVGVLKQMLSERAPRMCVFQEGSNVTGEMLELRQVAAACVESGTMLLIDAAQTAGAHHQQIVPGVDFWCTSGHKGLFGSAGAGVLWLSERVQLEPVLTGGTGSNSESHVMPVAYPDHLEAGTAPGPAIAALKAGAQWIREQGRAKLADHELRLCGKFLQWADSQPWLKLYHPCQVRHLPVVSFAVEGCGSSEVGQFLDLEYGICVRSGLHCAASAHKTLGTSRDGLVRVSFGPFNTEQDVDLLCAALSGFRARLPG